MLFVITFIHLRFSYFTQSRNLSNKILFERLILLTLSGFEIKTTLGASTNKIGLLKNRKRLQHNNGITSHLISDG